MFLRSLAERDRQPEIMDDPTLDPSEHRKALRGLARVNRWTGSASLLWPSIMELARERGSRPLRILDVATGSGDVPLGLLRLASKAGVDLEITACDISPVALAAAREKAEAAPIRFVEMDVLNTPLPGGFDAVVSSLFLHHLDDADQVRILQSMANATTGLMLVNDLRRSRWSYVQVWIGMRLLTRSRVVHVDGPLSIRAALTVQELQSLAGRAGLESATVRPAFPCRMLLKWKRDGKN